MLPVAAADINGDGKPDLLFSTGPGVVFGNGDGTFADSRGAPGLLDFVSPRCAFHDMDGDGHLDAVCGYGYDGFNNLLGETRLKILHGKP